MRLCLFICNSSTTLTSSLSCIIMCEVTPEGLRNITERIDESPTCWCGAILVCILETNSNSGNVASKYIPMKAHLLQSPSGQKEAYLSLAKVSSMTLLTSKITVYGPPQQISICRQDSGCSMEMPWRKG